ncbi:MAG: hypothetical protein ACHQK9_18745, partial [Reyranellales bacterium]
MRLLPKAIVLCMLAMVSLAAAAAAPQTQPAKIDKPATVDYRERYGVLTDRNMFLRDRRGPRSRWGDGPSS